MKQYNWLILNHVTVNKNKLILFSTLLNQTVKENKEKRMKIMKRFCKANESMTNARKQ